MHNLPFWFDSSIWQLQDLLWSRNPSSQESRSDLKSFFGESICITFLYGSCILVC
jgi:hypothetical protein